MVKLDRTVLEESVTDTTYRKYDSNLPEKVLQIGEGNFLRGFVDWMIHQMNKQGIFKGSVVAVQPTPHGRVLPKLKEQDWLYTVILRGITDGKKVDEAEVIPAISRGINPYEEWEQTLKVAESDELELIISNTTEAGITYMQEPYHSDSSPLSFPGKVTALLYHRYKHFSGDVKAGLHILPCELIEENGGKLKYIVKRIARDWNLPSGFLRWLETANRFYDTLVDRIVTGYPKSNAADFASRLGYEDAFFTVGEPYHLFCIDGPAEIKQVFPLDQAGLRVKWGDIEQYRELKVRLLNGPHTMMASAGYLAGADTVLDVMKDKSLRLFVERGFEEIGEALPFGDQEKRDYAEEVKQRFLNPYNQHYLQDIGMNAVNKFKSRLLPTLSRYIEKTELLPNSIILSLAAILVYFRPVHMNEHGIVGRRNGKNYQTRESELVSKVLANCWEEYEQEKISIEEFVFAVLGNRAIWDEDLNEIEQLTQTVSSYVRQIISMGMKETLTQMLQKNYSSLT
ncbi:tagaturonate reductase [Sediminibacillus dalangtanensis]|uniref:Tagaturonate reductase n=1 Tax=Sediminibacillus dalangtanensis TaxID=2729421 RepID=A0ABX7VUL6_9BACI|nr:tagaturonate reductase [Sediminibacillus dalangtanensis]QTM99163.1 tagaturonate reductase [Sediminibacillus dalangtanensis]